MDCGADTPAGNAQAVERDVPAELFPAGETQVRGNTSLDVGCAEQCFQPRGLIRVVERVPDGDAAVFEVMDNARRAAVDADEGHCAEDAFRVEPFGEAGFDAKSVHEHHDARVRPEAWLHKLLRVLDGGGLQRADDPIDLAQLRSGGDGRRVRQVEVTEVAVHCQAVASDGFEVAPHQEAHVVAGLRRAAHRNTRRQLPNR